MISSQNLDFLKFFFKKVINLNKRIQKNILMEIHIINEKESFSPHDVSHEDHATLH